MKKWTSVILSAALALSLPTSAFAISTDSGAITKSDLTIDGQIDAKWEQTDRISFSDAASGVKGNYRLMWDEGNVYVLVELIGAAKFWDTSKKPLLLSLWYNGEGKSKAEGYVAVSWPKLEERHDNGLHLGWFKGDEIVKAESVTGDDAIIELKLPWEYKDGTKLSNDTKIGFGLMLKSLDEAKADTTGELSFDITDNDIAKLKPPFLNIARLVKAMNAGASVGGNGNIAVGLGIGGVTIEAAGDASGNVGGNTGSSSGGSNGGKPTGTVGGNNGGTIGASAGGTVVGGVTRTKGNQAGRSGGQVVVAASTGVIPSAMPRTGGGGASVWTD
jgi:hypothetical protein